MIEMQRKELKPGEIYFTQRGRYGYGQMIRLIKVEDYQTSRTDVFQLVPAVSRNRRTYDPKVGFPVVTVGTGDTKEQVRKLRKIDLSKVELKSGAQTIDGVEIRVTLVSSRDIVRTVEDHLAYREEARKAEEIRQERLDQLEAQRKAKRDDLYKNVTRFGIDPLSKILVSEPSRESDSVRVTMSAEVLQDLLDRAVKFGQNNIKSHWDNESLEMKA